MADIDLIFQGLRRANDHKTALTKLLTNTKFDHFLISVAFLRRSGVEQIRIALEPVSKKVTAYVGIRNGVTSADGLEALIGIGINPFLVDMATNQKTFHPKIYAGYNESSARVIIGSANMTSRGLNMSVEASISAELDRAQIRDERLLVSLVDTLAALPVDQPGNVFRVGDVRETQELLRTGRLEDERLLRMPPTRGATVKGQRDTLRPMRTFTVPRPAPKGAKVGQTPSPEPLELVLMWESKGLTARDLNIPKGSNTHATGDMNFKKGNMVDIDQRHYFRDVVFGDLRWDTEPSGQHPHIERATAKLELILKNFSYGVYELEITHNSRTDTRSYQQNNCMTKLKWGAAKEIIAKEDILGRTLRLYKRGDDAFAIIIE